MSTGSDKTTVKQQMKIWKKFMKMYPEFPDPIHQPEKFKYFVKTFKYVYNRNTNDNT